MSERAETPTPTITRLGDLLSEWEEDATAAHLAHKNGTPRGPVTGLPKLDRDISGALQPGMHIIHGQPGAGKTAFVLQIAGMCGCPCLYVTCEMGTLELFRRITARVTGTFLGKLKSGELMPSQSVAYARQAAAACPQLVLLDATRAYASPSYIYDVATLTRGDARHLLIIVDSIHSWAEGAYADLGGATEYESLNMGLSALRGLSQRLGCSVLGVAERNRASMKGGGLSAGAGTRKLEYGCETLFDLSRKDDDKPDANGEFAVTLRIEKNRNGTPGRKHELMFDGAQQKFREAF